MIIFNFTVISKTGFFNWNIILHKLILASNFFTISDSEGSIIDDIVHEKEVERMMCATSLPMSIPTFSHHPRASVFEDDEEDLVSEY